MAFLAVAVASALLYAGWVAWVPLLPENVYAPLLDLGKITGYTWRAALLYLNLVAGAYAVYALGYWLVLHNRARLALIFGAGACLCFELVWAYPATAADVFGYVAQGRLLAVYHLNPFVVAPTALPATDPILSYLSYRDEPSPYGPLWALVEGAIAWVARGSDAALLIEVLLYKAVAGLAHLAGAAVIYRIARKLTTDPARAQASAYLYLWNPLLLWEMIGSAHNDGVMMLFALLGVWCFVAGANHLVLPALMTGAMIKLPIVFMVPVMFVGVWRRGRAAALEGAVLAVALAAVMYWPFWEGPYTLAALRRTDLFTGSLGSLLRLLLEPSIGEPQAGTLAGGASLGAFLGIGVLAIYVASQAQTMRDALRPVYVVLVAGLLLATTWFQAWYVVWPLGVAASLAEPRRHLEVALLSLGGLLQYVVFIYLWVMGYFPAGDNLAVQGAAYLCIVGPLALGFLMSQQSRVNRPA